MLRLLSSSVRQHSSLPATAINVKLNASNVDSDKSYVKQLQAELPTAKRFEELPGPTRWQMWRGFQRGGEFENLPMDKLMQHCRQRYGDTYIMPGLFGMPTNVISFSIDSFEKIFRTEGAYPVREGSEPIIHYRKKRADGFFRDCIGLLGSGPEWGRVRRAVNPVLMQHRNAALYAAPMQRVGNQFVQRIREIRDPATLEVPGDFINDINHLTFESVAVIALERELGLIRHADQMPEAEQLFRNIEILMNSFFELAIKPSMYKYVATPTYRRFSRAMDEIFDTCSMYVNKALERIEQRSASAEQSGGSMLEQLLSIDRKLAVVLAMDMLMGGVDTTSTALVGILLNLAKHPEQQAKLRAEIREKLPPPGEDFTLSDMKTLPYLSACIKESQRLYPVTFGNMRTTGVDLVLDGYRIPQGTRVMMNSNLLLSDERFYPRAKEFLPERWLRRQEGDEVTSQLVNNNVSPFLYLPFGFGPRMCAGKRIVDMELELTVANLIRNFEIEFNHSTENAFQCRFIYMPAIPLKFKFTDV